MPRSKAKRRLKKGTLTDEQYHRLRHFQCERKVPYLTIKAASDAAENHMKRHLLPVDEPPYEAYKCSFCPYYHFGQDWQNWFDNK